MVALGEANSRMKDFYDVWTFDVPTDDFEVLTSGFAQRHLVQWNAFVKKMGEGALANRFPDVIEDLWRFVVPMFRCIALGEPIGAQWRFGKGWLGVP